MQASPVAIFSIIRKKESLLWKADKGGRWDIR
jgi:hypothetical protein